MHNFAGYFAILQQRSFHHLRRARLASTGNGLASAASDDKRALWLRKMLVTGSHPPLRHVDTHAVAEHAQSYAY